MIVTNGRDNEITVVVRGAPTKLGYGNHYELIRQLLALADECLLVSPYLYKDFAPLVYELTLEGLSVELISTCVPSGDDQLTKPFSLRSFASELQRATGHWPTIGIDQKLHSKLYVFWADHQAFAGIVSSANLTHSGLQRNHETGVVLMETSLLEDVAETARASLDFVSLSEYQIHQLCLAAEIGARDVEPAGDRDVGLGNILNGYATPSAGNRNIVLRPYASYFIKVSGVRDRPILPEHRRPFDEPHGALTFSKSPGNISLGDCLLEVAVGGKCFLSYYACASGVYERTPEERREDPDCDRWPYYVYANNLSLHYGKVWFEDPIFYDDVVSEFKRAFPDTPVTAAGKDHFLGAMQMGHSYIAVTKEFGEFAKERIDRFRSHDNGD